MINGLRELENFLNRDDRSNLVEWILAYWFCIFITGVIIFPENWASWFVASIILIALQLLLLSKFNIKIFLIAAVIIIYVWVFLPISISGFKILLGYKEFNETYSFTVKIENDNDIKDIQPEDETEFIKLSDDERNRIKAASEKNRSEINKMHNEISDFFQKDAPPTVSSFSLPGPRYRSCIELKNFYINNEKRTDVSDAIGPVVIASDNQLIASDNQYYRIVSNTFCTVEQMDKQEKEILLRPATNVSGIFNSICESAEKDHCIKEFKVDLALRIIIQNTGIAIVTMILFSFAITIFYIIHIIKPGVEFIRYGFESDPARKK